MHMHTHFFALLLNSQPVFNLPTTATAAVCVRVYVRVCVPTAHLLSVRDPATGQPLTRAQLKAEVAIFMAAGVRLLHLLTDCLPD